MPHGAVGTAPGAQYRQSPHGWRICIREDISPELYDWFESQLEQRLSTCFASKLEDMRDTVYCGREGDFKIPFKENHQGPPLFQKSRRYSPIETAISQEKVAELLLAGFIEPASPTCQYASRPTMPAKKDVNGNWTDHRFCVDFRHINQASIPDRYALHHQEDILHKVASGKYHSKLDCRQAFMQVNIDPADRPKTAFWAGNKLYQFRRMPYGLVNGSAKCQRIMDAELAAAELQDCAAAFIDDVAVWTGEEGGVKAHMDAVLRVLDALGRVGLRMHPGKCLFLMLELELLGHSVSTAGISPHESKVATIKSLSSPANLTELRSKLAFINYYRCYIAKFADIAAPLNSLLRQNVPWAWGAEQERAFNTLKSIICTPGVVLKPFNPKSPSTVYTDWSKVGISAVLHQLGDDGQEHLVACLSRSLNPHERNYSSYEGELLAAVWGVKAFRLYLHGVPFRLITDHQPLKWLMANQELCGKHMRWALILQEYLFSVEHRAGTAHANADVPSRYPLAASFDPTGACLDPVQGPGAAFLAACNLWQAIDSSETAAAFISFIDTYAPDADALLEQPPLWVGEDCPHRAVAEAAALHEVVERWVEAAWWDLARARPCWGQALEFGPGAAGLHGVRPVERLNTYPVGQSLFAAACEQGLVLYEPFGGLCAGLDMLLTCGVRVCQYLYSDIDPAAQAVARARVDTLHAQYPHLFPLEASRGAFDLLPMDVRQIGAAQLVRAGAKQGKQWLVVGGWSCEDLSPAGQGRGLRGSRSSNFYDAVRIVGALQQLQPAQPPGFILENTAMQAHFAHQEVREQDFPAVCSVLGEPVLLDAAQLGSFAHRLRNFWSNLAPPELVDRVLSEARRAEGRTVDDVLDPGRRAQVVKRVQGYPFYSCNEIGQQPCVLPTLVAYTGSRAFTDGAAGMLHTPGGGLEEPNPDERERIMGYYTGCTRAPGVSERERHEIMGRAMDRHVMVHLFAVYWSLAPRLCRLMPQRLQEGHALNSLEQLYGRTAASILRQQGWVPGGPLLAPNAREPICEPLIIEGNFDRRGLGYGQGSCTEGQATTGVAGQGSCTTGQATAAVAALCEGIARVGVGEGRQLATAGGGLQDSRLGAVYSEGELHDHFCALSTVADGQDKAECGEPNKLEPQGEGKGELVKATRADPYSDAGLLFFLREGRVPATAVGKEAARIRRRAGRYCIVEGQLQRRMGDGARRQVPPLHKRVDLIRDTHERTGHFGIKRTKHLLLSSFWWPGLEDDVKRVLAACEPCQRVKASFNAERPQLQPLPIMGLFYRWGVDLAGPFPPSACGNTTVCIMIEHFSKMIELVAMPNKLAHNTAYAFLSTVLARYGACAEVVTDQGTEFEGEFASLLADSFIDHRTTSSNNPQADGLAERAVQTIKNALEKHVAQHKRLNDWDWQLHWIALGYRASKQASTGISPYELLFGVPPVIPPAVKERVEDPVLDLRDPAQAAELVLAKAALLRERTAMAGGNLRIAQHRDMLRYERTRSGTYMPVKARFAVGDFVYLRRRNVVNTLQTEARPTIMRVQRVLPTGVLQLLGRCGTVVKVNGAECAPCHLTGINPALDPSLRRVEADFPCELCGSPDDEASMLICDGCLKGFHLSCLQPPLSEVPEPEIWVCPYCLQQGVTAERLAVLRQMNMPVAVSDAAVFPSVQQRARDAEAQQLHGKVVWLQVKGQGGGQVRAVLEYVPRVDRLEHSRCPLRAIAEGQPPLYMSLQRAEKLVKAGPPEGTVALSEGLAAVFVADSGVPVQQQVSSIAPGMDQGQVASALRGWSGVKPSKQLLDSYQAAVGQLLEQPEGRELGIPAVCVQALLRMIDLRWCGKIAVAGGVAAELLQVYRDRYGGKGFWADKLPSKAVDQLSTGWYKKAHLKVPLDWVFLYPSEGVIEMAVGLAVQQAHKGVAVLLPRVALSDVSGVFAAMLQGWEEEGRAVCVSSPTCSCQLIWLVVFKSAQMEQTMVSVRGRAVGSNWELGSWR